MFVRSYGYLIGTAVVEGEYDYLTEGSGLRKKFYSPYWDDDYPHVRDVIWVSLAGGMKQPLTLTKLTKLKNRARDPS